MDSIVYQIEESNVANNHEAYCPELLIPGFGDTAEEARIAEEQIRQQRMVFEYLNHLYEYLKNSNYFDSAPDCFRGGRQDDRVYDTKDRYNPT